MQFIKEAIKAVIFYKKLQMMPTAPLFSLRAFLTRAMEIHRLSLLFNFARACDSNRAPHEIVTSWQFWTKAFFVINVLTILFV